jgi:acetyl-CoA carboxylase biotin carboxyl carrier protein
MKMDLNYIKKLIKMLDTSGISEIEIEEQGTRLKLSKPRPKITTGGTPVHYGTFPVQGANVEFNRAPEPEQTQSQEISDKAQDTGSDNVFEVRSPMVGTFYRSPAPDADPYVKVGDTISAGSVLCIIEAMKLMNEIESEISGKVIKILVENTQAVEYNQPLFLIEKS